MDEQRTDPELSSFSAIHRARQRGLNAAAIGGFLFLVVAIPGFMKVRHSLRPIDMLLYLSFFMAFEGLVYWYFSPEKIVSHTLICQCRTGRSPRRRCCTGGHDARGLLEVTHAILSEAGRPLRVTEIAVTMRRERVSGGLRAQFALPVDPVDVQAATAGGSLAAGVGGGKAIACV